MNSALMSALPVLMVALLATDLGSPFSGRRTDLDFQSARGRSGQSGLTVADSPAPPATLELAVSSADAVVVAKVLSTGMAALSERSGLVFRDQKVKVLEVLSGDPVVPAGGVITVRQFGGSVDVGGRIVRTESGERILESGDEVVVFLAKDGGIAQLFRVAFGRSGMIDIASNGRATAFGRMARYEELGGADLSKGTLVAAIRAKRVRK